MLAELASDPKVGDWKIKIGSNMFLINLTSKSAEASLVPAAYMVS